MMRVLGSRAGAALITLVAIAAPAQATQQQGGGSDRPDPSLAPNYGTIALNHGFRPDPRTVRVIPGGPLRASALGNNCIGMISRNPDVQLSYSAGRSALYFRSRSSITDTTLVIRAPDGRWYCDDNSARRPDRQSGQLDPEVAFETPASGDYDVWVGMRGGVEGPVSLQISEVPLN